MQKGEWRACRERWNEKKGLVWVSHRQAVRSRSRRNKKPIKAAIKKKDMEKGHEKKEEENTPQSTLVYMIFMQVPIPPIPDFVF